ncbi:SDR family NAD(P)-dependent oxidoreductase [Amycolatopsis cihanbeyliensis]|uniref:SDR family NAD(P)-dependent oxidoreductase n=1 Tax=Amycolatopsis cihanbeyliensis TaxID=1128664 RepID=UPI001FE27DE6|nr:3-oxoacyl-ACP reductase family protein [Amycolatopsis cihanbeyliensis]
MNDTTYFPNKQAVVLDDRLDGKVALVTGGSRGIGAAVAIRLATAGADVVLTYQHSVDQAENVVAEVKAAGRRGLAIQADSADATEAVSAVERAVAEFGRLDVLVNNAGAAYFGTVEDIPVADVDRVLAVNVRGPFLAAQAAARHLPAGGRIINIGSCAAERGALPGLTLYGMSKAAVAGLTRTLARELGPRGITVNTVHPGPIDTDMNPADGPAGDANRQFVALGGYGQAVDVAATVAHLAGESGRYITGAGLAVDGGFAA